MPETLADAFELRRPLLQQAAEYLTEQLREMVRQEGISASVNFEVDTTSEFLKRAQRLSASSAFPLLDVVEQIRGRVTLSSADHIPVAERLVAQNLTVVRKSWGSVNGALPELHLHCVIPPQAKPDGWARHNNLPNLFALTLNAQSTSKAVGQPILRLTVASGDGEPCALIMKGGGIKGLAYVGALRELARKYAFNWFVGTSAGAVAAVLLGAGYTVDELKTILEKKNFADFFDAAWPKACWNLLVHRGLYPANTLTEWIDTLLAQKLQKSTRVRLSDLPYRVTVFASQRDKREMRFDSFDADTDAAFAVRCSMSIPFVFVPQTNQGIRTYDGGMQHNFPVDELLRAYPGTRFVSLYLGPEVYEPVRQKSVWRDLMAIWTESGDAETVAKYKDYTVIIDTRPIDTLDFGLTEEEKTYLLACGKAGALAHLANSDGGHAEAKKVRDDLKTQVTAARQAKRRVRFRKRLIIGGVLAVAVSLLVWFLWLKPVDPSTPQLLYASKMKAHDVSLGPGLLSMPGIVVHRRSVVIDLSNEVPVPPEERDDKKTSPSVHSYTISGERLSEEGRYLAYEFASQRRLVDIACLTDHPHAVWYRRDQGLLGKGFNNVWTLVIDVGNHSIEIPFTVKFRVTRYNAYQAENKNFVGHLVAGNEKAIDTRVYLPRPYRLAEKPRLLQKRQPAGTTTWSDFVGDGDVSIVDDGAGFDWYLRRPQPGFAYAAEINWVKKNE